MASQTTQFVEFVGGPLDGYVYRITFPTEQMATYVALPINQHLIALQDGQQESRTAATSVAVYCLKKGRHNYHYEFRAAACPQDFQLEYWTG